MTAILASLLRYYESNDDGAPVPCALRNTNGIADNIRGALPHRRKFVCVANDPQAFDENDFKADLIRRGFKLAGFCFDRFILLDGRNANNARSVCQDASLFLLRGGKCTRQLAFFNEIGMRGILSDTDALVVGVSAGAMNLCKTVANFPEELADLSEPRLLDGLGLIDKIFIPHFDCDACAYQFPCDDFDIARDYILPMSQCREFLGIANDGYALIDDNGKMRVFGNACTIKDGKITKLR